MKKNFQIPHFIRKKIISSHLDKKSSSFCYVLTLKSEKFQSNQEKIMNLAVLRAILFDYGYFSEPQRQIVSPLFFPKKIISSQIKPK